MLIARKIKLSLPGWLTFCTLQFQSELTLCQSLIILHNNYCTMVLCKPLFFFKHWESSRHLVVLCIYILQITLDATKMLHNISNTVPTLKSMKLSSWRSTLDESAPQGETTILMQNQFWKTFFLPCKFKATHHTEWQKQCSCRRWWGRHFWSAVGHWAPCHPCRRPAWLPSATVQSPSGWSHGYKLFYWRRKNTKQLMKHTLSLNNMVGSYFMCKSCFMYLEKALLSH